MRAGAATLACAIFAAGCGHVRLDLLPVQRSQEASSPDGARVGVGTKREGGIAAEPGCRSSADCGRGEPHCDVTSGRCVECLTPEQCDAPRTCDVVARACATPCTGDSDCDRYTQTCDTRRGVCVECLDDSGCNSQSNRFCLTDTEQCVECLSDANCDAPEPLCDLTRHLCVECSTDVDCPKGLSCDERQQSCVSR